MKYRTGGFNIPYNLSPTFFGVCIFHKLGFFLGHQAHFAVFVNIKVTFSFTHFKVVKLSNQILYNFKNYILLKKMKKKLQI